MALSVCRILGLMAFIGAVAPRVPPLRADEFTPVPMDGQLFGDELGAKLSELPLSYRDCIWPSGPEIEGGVPLNEVPSRVLDHAEKWVGRILRREWLPEALRPHFMAWKRELPLVPPQRFDYLGVRHELGGYRIQVMENGTAMGILIAPVRRRGTTMPIDEYITRSTRSFLNLPEERIKSMRVSVRGLTLGSGTKLSYGTMECERETRAPGPLWWERIYVWSDGSSVYWGILERDGRPPRPEARPGSPSRF